MEESIEIGDGNDSNDSNVIFLHSLSIIPFPSFDILGFGLCGIKVHVDVDITVVDDNDADDADVVSLDADVDARDGIL
jgi:hypothetical protein